MLERRPGHSIDQRLQVHLKENHPVGSGSRGGECQAGVSRREFRTVIDQVHLRENHIIESWGLGSWRSGEGGGAHWVCPFH